MPSKQEWAYIAGFFDGEGCVSNSFTAKQPMTIQIVIAQRDPADVLYWMWDTLGLGNVYPKNAKAGNYTQYVIRRGDDVETFLLGIRPYAIYKLAQIDIALEILLHRVGYSERYDAVARSHIMRLSDSLKLEKALS